MQNQENEPGFPPEFVEALNLFYSKYSSDPTDAQKLNILNKYFGEPIVSIHYYGQGYDTPEVQEKMCQELMMKTLELDYLQEIGLYKPEYF